MARHPRAPSALDTGRGSSLIELLLASLLFLAALLAAAPLFMRAVRDVRAGAARSAAAALAQNGLEVVAPPWADEPRVEHYSFDRRRWQVEPPAAPDRSLWVRETALRRYPLGAIDDGRLEPGESAPHDGRRPPEALRVGLIGVEVRVSRRAGGRPVASLERLEWTVD